MIVLWKKSTGSKVGTKNNRGSNVILEAEFFPTEEKEAKNTV
jgi:hypothetical protein